MKRHLITIGVFLAIMAVCGFLVAASGVMPIKASSGHWAITQWFLEFSMSRSVSTHSLGIQVPPLDESRLIVKGAAHYDIGCRPCHGSPTLHHPRIAAALTPHPPYLPETIPEWDPEELFYIVKHGVKFTGMPAWPTQERDDEVWAMTAFLLRFRDLDAAQYQRLVSNQPPPQEEATPLEDLVESESPPQIVIENCARCHGQDGEGRGDGAFPRLAGQKADYLVASLAAFAAGERHSGIMEPVAAGLSDEDRLLLGRYYSAIVATDPVDDAPSTESIQRGREIAHEGVPARRVPACAQCHGPSESERNPHYPVLAGLHEAYLISQLTLFKDRHRGGTPYSHLMHPVADALTKEQMSDVAAYYSSLRP